jgi:hypothetical protein
MIVVRCSADPEALADFLLPICVDEVANSHPQRPFTRELLVAALAAWDVVEFFDTEKGATIGAAAREPGRHVHIYVDSARRIFWAPHASLEAALDIFLSDSECLHAAIPLANRQTIRMVRKLGFIQTRTENGMAFLVLSPLSRNKRSLHGKSGRL